VLVRGRREGHCWNEAIINIDDLPQDAVEECFVMLFLKTKEQVFSIDVFPPSVVLDGCGVLLKGRLCYISVTEDQYNNEMDRYGNGSFTCQRTFSGVLGGVIVEDSEEKDSQPVGLAISQVPVRFHGDNDENRIQLYLFEIVNNLLGIIKFIRTTSTSY
jgi:hypothetical protein